MKITIETIPHKDQRYETAGDWQMDGGDIHIRVSAMPDDRYEFLVGIHEAIEAFLCFKEGVDQDSVDQFDKGFEVRRETRLKAMRETLAFGDGKPHRRGATEGRINLRKKIRELEEAEPGDDPAAPYHRQHQIATDIERMLAAALGVDWNAYESTIGEL